MDTSQKIPQEIWEKDCKYCSFRAMEENTIPQTKYKKPCKIMMTAHIENGHCRSCRPIEGFGICATCEYFNGFHDDVEDKNAIYCTLTDGPVNRRNTMPHINAGYSREITHFNYSYFTCDRYTVNKGPFMGKDRLLKLALQGRIQKNFNPDTFEPLKYIDGEPIEEWQIREQAYEDSKPENIKKKKLQDVIKQKIKKDGGSHCMN